MSFSAYIDKEAKSNLDSPSDIDNFRDRYVDIDKTLNLSVISPGFEIPTLDKWLFILLSNSELVDWDNKWTYRPDYVSYKYYNTTIYWYIILYVNQIDSLEDFKDKDKIVIPNIISIKDMISDKVPITYENSYTESEYPSVKYYKRYPLDELEIETINASAELEEDTTTVLEECELYEKDESFTLTSVDIINKYVDLSYPPANYSSIEFKIDGYTSVSSYGYDYILKYIPGTSNLQRISWSKEDCTYGNGLEDILEAADIINIKYLYLQTGCDPCMVVTDDVLDGGIYE